MKMPCPGAQRLLLKGEAVLLEFPKDQDLAHVEAGIGIQVALLSSPRVTLGNYPISPSPPVRAYQRRIKKTTRWLKLSDMDA